jgi:transcriptional regulator with PAS, ATPase and Fis domain
VNSGKFREDLYYRLNVFPVRVPPLCERKDDMPLLVSHFIHVLNKRTGKQVVDVSREVMRLFMDYHWPGNVRELENAMEHAFVLCNHDRIENEDLPSHLRHQHQAGADDHPATDKANLAKRKKVSKSQLLTLLDDCGWNKAEAARRLGVSHTSVWKYMKKWDIPLKRS